MLEKLLRAGLDVDAPILLPKPPGCNRPGCSTSGCKGGTGCSGLALVADASQGLLLGPPATADSSSSSGGGSTGSNKGGRSFSRVCGLPGSRWVVAEDEESWMAGGEVAGVVRGEGLDDDDEGLVKLVVVQDQMGCMDQSCSSYANDASAAAAGGGDCGLGGCSSSSGGEDDGSSSDGCRAVAAATRAAAAACAAAAAAATAGGAGSYLNPQQQQQQSGYHSIRYNANTLVQGWPDPAVVATVGSTPLHMAAAGGQVDLVSWLVSPAGGAKRAVVDGAGAGPLAVAAAVGAEEVVKVLLQDPVDLHTVDRLGRSVLHMACYSGSLQLLQLLLAARAVGNDQGSSSSAGGAAAAGSGSRDGDGGVVGVREEAEAIPAAVAAVAGGDVSISSSSSSGGVLGLRDVAAAADGRVLVHYAALSGKVEMMSYLVEQGGCEVDVRDNMGNTPWHLAAERVSGRGEGYVVGVVLRVM